MARIRTSIENPESARARPTGNSAGDLLEMLRAAADRTDRVTEASASQQEDELESMGVGKHAGRFGGNPRDAIERDDDPVVDGVKVPLEFWKVAATVNAAGELIAVGFLVSQKELVAPTTLEVDVEQVARTFQVPSATSSGPSGSPSASSPTPTLPRGTGSTNRSGRIRSNSRVSSRSS
jgi:hypothetical protein